IQAILAVDLDGDGKTDLVVQQNRVINIALGTATGFATPQTLTFGNTPIAGLHVGDFNHDGRLDIVTAGAMDDDPPSDYRALCAIATDAGFVATSRMQSVAGGIMLGDFTGDGYVDLASAINGIVLYPSTP